MSDVTVIMIILFCILIAFVLYYKSYLSSIYDTVDACYIFDNNIDKNINILELLKLVAEKYPKNPALKLKQDKKWKTITYAEYYKKVKNFAQSTNYWLGDNISTAILGFNSPGWFYAHLGTMLNGGQSIGLDPSYNSNTCKTIIHDANVELLVVENDKQLNKFVDDQSLPLRMIIYYSPVKEETIAKFKIPVISMGNFMTEVNKLKKNSDINNVATVIYTKKSQLGSMITHKNIISTLKTTMQLLKTKSLIKTLGHEQIISYMPLNNITTQIFDIYLSIACVGCVWFADKNALNTTIVETIQDIKPTIFVGGFDAWNQVSKVINDKKNNLKNKITKVINPLAIANEIGLDRCKLCLNIDHNIENGIEKIDDIDVYNALCMNETCGLIALSSPGMSKMNSVGLPIMNVKISKDGEIIVNGNNLFIGYYHNDRKTNSKLTKDGWFKTGYNGKIDVNGYLYIVNENTVST